ncbi:hypothetical protein PHYPSEUDO_010831 [Phytophthora pseudosyringae]|uniref:VHS domain-containing protein n=1 Tax=Phytophthora pseudosyringae TaxID=221518 RepID=A0A8T1WB43_9STRA|nr:hypothetical protein PHYPSEUDO_010831 [Phytophthora pseudosyringae]
MATHGQEAMYPHGGATASGIQALNSENEAARLDEALSSFFRVSVATATRPRGRGGRRMPPQRAENGSETTPEAILKRIKRLLRDAEAPAQSQYILRLHAMILHQLKRAKTSPTAFSRVRSAAAALELCREIFKRSTVFRALIVKQTASFFDQLLLAAGEDPSANVSRALRARSRGSKQLAMVLALIETWERDFGDKYPSLVAGYGVLVERGYEFPHERERRQEERERDVDTQRHRERVNDAKRQQRDREMARYVPEMEQVLVEMNRVFEILVPTLDAFHMEERDDEEEAMSSPDGDEGSGELKVGVRDDAVGGEQNGGEDDDGIQWEDVSVSPPATAVNAGDHDDEEDVEWESVAAEGESTNDNQFNGIANDEDAVDDHMDITDIVQAYGLGSSSYQLTIEVSKQVCEESAENDALFKSLADGALRMRKRFLPLLDDWEQHSTLTGQSSSSSSTLQSQREVLLRIRDLRDRMTRALLKWDDLVQGSKGPKRNTSARSAVVSLPLEAYNPPTKRRRHSRVEP